MESVPHFTLLSINNKEMWLTWHGPLCHLCFPYYHYITYITLYYLYYCYTLLAVLSKYLWISLLISSCKWAHFTDYNIEELRGLSDWPKWMSGDPSTKLSIFFIPLALFTSIYHKWIIGLYIKMSPISHLHWPQTLCTHSVSHPDSQFHTINYLHA